MSSFNRDNLHMKPFLSVNGKQSPVEQSMDYQRIFSTGIQMKWFKYIQYKNKDDLKLKEQMSRFVESSTLPTRNKN